MGGAFLAFGVVFSLSYLFVSFFGEDFGGKEIEVPRLDGRTPHFGAGKGRLGTGLGEGSKGGKTQQLP